MTTCGGALVGVEDIFEKHRVGERFVVSVTETHECRNALGGERPVDPAVGEDLLRGHHVGARLGDGLRQALSVKTIGKKRSGARDGWTLCCLAAVAIKRLIRVIGGTTGVGPSQG